MNASLPQPFIGGEAAEVLTGVARKAAQAAAGEEPHRLRPALLDIAHSLTTLLERQVHDGPLAVEWEQDRWPSGDQCPELTVTTWHCDEDADVSK